MEDQNNENKVLLPHHKQQLLCTTRLPYRQGRKLTAVKVYSIGKESNHLLIFGVPSLNLRQETKALFSKFGKLLQFNVSKEHASETFTETYHAQYEKIQSARYAKRMIDTKNFYGGLLHVCYAPELENIHETKQKLVQRQRDVVFRLKNLNNEGKKNISAEANNQILGNEMHTLTNVINDKIQTKCKDMDVIGPRKLNMGDFNTISMGNKIKSVNKKRKVNDNVNFQPCFIENKRRKSFDNIIIENNITISKSDIKYNNKDQNNKTESNKTCDNNKQQNITEDKNIEIIDCTGVEKELITNINENLNYDKFGNEIIRKVPVKPVNKIQFHLNKKS